MDCPLLHHIHYRTAVFGALLRLLLSPHERLLAAGEAEKMESRWYDLVVKCTIKVTKSLPQTIEVVHRMLLRQLHVATSTSKSAMSLVLALTTVANKTDGLHVDAVLAACSTST
jgi:hypothetical protein